MTVDPRTLTAELRAESTPARRRHDPYERARAAERAVSDALARTRARMWRQCHWWGRETG